MFSRSRYFVASLLVVAANSAASPAATNVAHPQPSAIGSTARPAAAQVPAVPVSSKGLYRLAAAEAASGVDRNSMRRFERRPAAGSAAMKWEIAYLALAAVDTAQTISCLNKDICEEVNPIFGKRPKTGTLIATKAGVGLLHFAAFKYLQRYNPLYALRMAQVSAVLQGGVVAFNARVAF